MVDLNTKLVLENSLEKCSWAETRYCCGFSSNFPLIYSGCPESGVIMASISCPKYSGTCWCWAGFSGACCWLQRRARQKSPGKLCLQMPAAWCAPSRTSRVAGEKTTRSTGLCWACSSLCCPRSWIPLLILL